MEHQQLPRQHRLLPIPFPHCYHCCHPTRQPCPPEYQIVPIHLTRPYVVWERWYLPSTTSGLMRDEPLLVANGVPSSFCCSLLIVVVEIDSPMS